MISKIRNTFFIMALPVALVIGALVFVSSYFAETARITNLRQELATAVKESYDANALIWQTLGKSYQESVVSQARAAADILESDATSASIPKIQQLTHARNVLVLDSNQNVIAQSAAPSEGTLQSVSLIIQSFTPTTPYSSALRVDPATSEIVVCSVSRLPSSNSYIVLDYISPELTAVYNNARTSRIVTQAPRVANVQMVAIDNQSKKVTAKTDTSVDSNGTLDYGGEAKGKISIEGKSYSYSAMPLSSSTTLIVYGGSVAIITPLLISSVSIIAVALLVFLFVGILDRRFIGEILDGIDLAVDSLDSVTSGKGSVVLQTNNVPELEALTDSLERVLDYLNSAVSHAAKDKTNAELASDAKTSFLANMSHEIRTPMNGIIGFAELALDSTISDESKTDYLLRIKESGDGLLQIINDILDISKIEAGAMDLESIPFSLHEIFEACKNMISIKAEKKDISLFCYAEPVLNRKLIGDPTKLRQVLINLLNNSVKFTNVGGVKLLADIISTDEDSVTIDFKIRDSGIGMSPQQLEDIFAPFVQADSSTTRRYGGTGLGLSISKNIIEAMGGVLDVQSVEGLGSVFSFRLTFQTVAAVANLAPSTEELANEKFKGIKPIFSGSVLVCEDNSVNKKVILDHLTRIGLQPIIADNGAEGIERYRERLSVGDNPFDIILMDIHMPVMDGLEATAKLRSMNCYTPIVAMTANVITMNDDVYEKNGFTDYIPKPFKALQLWTCLDKYLKITEIQNLETGEVIKPKPVTPSAPPAPVKKPFVAPTSNAYDPDEIDPEIKFDFVRNHEHAISEIRDALNNGDHATAHRIAHTVKGLAALLNEEKLRVASMKVEVSMAQDNTGVDYDALDDMDMALNSLVASIKAQAPPPVDTSAVDASEQSVRQRLQTVLQLLEEDDMDVEGHLDFLRSVSGCTDAVNAIRDFDYIKAIQVVKAVLR